MTDIPVGSPPVPPGRHAAPGGWYPDPLDARRERYWDGWQWSKNTRDVELPHGAQAGGHSYPPAPYPPAPYPPAPYPPAQPYYPGQAPPNPYGNGGSPPQQGQTGPPRPGDPYPPQPPPGHYQPVPGPYQPAPYQPGGYTTNVPGKQAVATADGVPLAGWWLRVLAVMLDWVFVSLLAVIPNLGVYSRLYAKVQIYFNEVMSAAQSGQPAPVTPSTTSWLSSADQLTLTLVGLAVALAYQILFLRWKSATPGKLITGLRVVPVDHGQSPGPLPWNTILARTVVWVVPRVQAYLWLFRLADSLFPLWHPKRQALHDLAARTQVVKRR